MIAEVMNSTAMIRLQSLLQHRYGKGLTISFMSDVSDWDIDSQSPSLIEGDLRIPILNGSQFFATAVIKDANDLNSEDQTNISYLVKMVLEPTLYGLFLDSKISDSQHPTPENSQNVVSLFPKAEGFKPAPLKRLETGIIYLEGSSPTMNRKVVSAIHEISERWACVPYLEINQSIFSADDIRELGQVTLTIDELHRLSETDISFLHQFVRTANKDNEPLLIVSSIQPLADLNIADPVFKDRLNANCIKVDRLPIMPDVMTQALELLLEIPEEL